MLKKRNKKIQEEIKESIETAQNGITEIVDSYQEYEIYNAELLGREVDFNYSRVYIYMLCNYAQDISVMVSNERYSSLYPLLNNFLECYGLADNLIFTYFNGKSGEYRNILNRYYAATLDQRKNECDDFDPDFAISYEDGVNFIDIRITQMEKIIAEFFEEHNNRLEMENRDINILEIVSDICGEYNLPLDTRAKVIKALQRNEEFSDEERNRAIKLYVSAKSASQNNVQTTLTRILGMVEGSPALLLNKNEGIAPIVLEIAEKCLKDITEKVKREFNRL